MKGLADLWGKHNLAIVRGVGYPKPDHSHFRSMDIWQTADPDEPSPTGWIGRWLDTTGDDPLRAVNIGSVLPTLAIGAKHTASALDPASAPLSPRQRAELTGLATPDPRDSTAQGYVRGGYQAEHAVAQEFSRVSSAKPNAGANSLAAQLDLVGQCIKAGVPTRVHSVSLGGSPRSGPAGLTIPPGSHLRVVGAGARIADRRAMNMQQAVLEGIVVVLVLGWIVYRQTRWQVLDPRRAWRGPIILAVIGVVEVRTSLTGAAPGAAAVALLVLEAVSSVAVGVGMGLLSQFRWAEAGLEARTGLIGSLLWFVMLALRLGVDVWASADGAKIVVSGGMIVLMLALNRAGRTLVLLRRAQRVRPVTAGSFTGTADWTR
jgi:hypothetical protein